MKTGVGVGDLHSLLSTALSQAIEEFVDVRIAAALASLGQDTSSPWMTVPEAAAYARTSERTIERLVASERIRSTTLGRSRRLHRDDVDNYLKGRRA